MKVRLIILILVLAVLSSCSKDGYRIEGDKVVYESPWNTGNFTVIHDLNADPDTLKVLGDDNLTWAKDYKRVYRKYKYLHYMDADSFEVLSTAFAKDKDKVICGRDIMKEADPANFRIKTYKSKNGHKYVYGVDRKAAYLCDKEPNGYVKIVTQSIDSFEQLEDNFYRDNEKVWWGSRQLPNVHVETFKVLKNQYAKDINNVYYTYHLIEGADPATFKVTGTIQGKDKNHHYEMDLKR